MDGITRMHTLMVRNVIRENANLPEGHILTVGIRSTPAVNISWLMKMLQEFELIEHKKNRRIVVTKK